MYPVAPGTADHDSVTDDVVMFDDVGVPGAAGTAAGTVIVHVAFFAPVFVVAVIVAVPVALAVTSPDVDTVAIDVLELDHVTD